MPNDKRVAIIGGGAAGLSIALNLVEMGGADVTVIERDHLVSKSSGLSVGVFTRQYTNALDLDLRAYAHERMEHFEAAGDVTFNRVGYLRLGHDAAALESFELAVELQRERGIHDGRVLDSDGIGGVVPHMTTDDIAGGLYGPSDGYLDGHTLCQVYAERAERLGAKVLQRTVIEEVTGGGGRPFRLATNRGLVEADIVVNAAGAWADRVGDMLGAPVPVVAHREQICLGRFGTDLGYTMPFLMDYIVGSAKPGLYLRDEGHGHFVAGHHTNEPHEPPVPDPDTYNRAVSRDFVEAIAADLLERFPGLPEIGLTEGWTGLYPLSPDGRAMVGPHPADAGIVVVAGLGGVGINLSPAVGRLAAEWVLEGEFRTIANVDDLAVGRFDVVEAG
jgi:sarcosine oxidase subunit beta